MFLVSLAEGFIHLFQAAGKIFLDMMTGLIPMLICLLLAINFLMKLVGTVRMEKVAALLGRSRILTYGVLPVLGWFFMSSPGALTRNTASLILQRKQQRDQLQGQAVEVPDDSDSRLHNLNNPQPDSPR
ncbi:TPA: hypothetical protein JG916_001038 [Enterobacter hormaechei subsp. steigerwaltii]|nr:hypothetical protein P826_04363 [Enterobacter hormaechei]HAV1791625.1 hypothetical protein [Enterobacter hormaechei subsp. steigerwaltii]